MNVEQTQTTAAATQRPKSAGRQISAIIWIALAWLTGTIIFEINAIGDQPEHVKLEVEQDAYAGLVSKNEQASDGNSI